MSQISDEIIELIDKNRLNDLKKIKDQMTEKDYNQSVYNIIASKEQDSLELEQILNQIKNPAILSRVISTLKNNVAKDGSTSMVKNGSINISELVGQINELQTKYEAIEMNQNRGTVVGDAVITAATLHSMLENYENLTPEQQREVTRQVIENLDETIKNLTPETRKELEDRGLLESINKIKEPLEKVSRLQELARKENRTPKEEEEFKRLSNENPEFFDEKGNFDDKKAEKFIKDVLPVLEECDNFMKSLPTESKDLTDEQLHKIDKFNNRLSEINNEYKLDERKNKHLIETSDRLAEMKKNAVNRDVDPEKKEEQENIASMGEDKSVSKEDKRKFSEDQEQKNEENRSEYSKLNYGITQEQNPNTLTKDDFLQEIEQLPIALAKVGISQEQIKEALTQYKSYFENLEADDIAFLAEQTDEERASILVEEFDGMKSNEQTSQILKMMANITFDGKFKEILENPEKFKDFIKHFNQAISQDITQGKDVKLDGELSQLFAPYFKENAVDMDVSAIEEQKQQGVDIREEQPKPVEEPLVPQTEGNVQEDEDSTLSNLGQVAEEIKSQENMALEVQDNSFIGKIKRVLANMRDSKNKDSSKGFFSRLKDSVQSVFGNKKSVRYSQKEDEQKTDNLNANPTTPLSLDEQLKQGVDQSKFNQIPNMTNKGMKQVVKDAQEVDEEITQ